MKERTTRLEIKVNPPDYDCDEMFVDGTWVGFVSKTRDHVGLQKCLECGRENYAAAVLGGVCAWCGFDIKPMWDEYKKEKSK